jgi:ferredoxin-NADP reductase
MRVTNPRETPPRAGSTALKLAVRSVHFPADRVLSIELGSNDGSPLPPWDPGAHIDVHLPSGRVRSYSLHGDPGDRSSYHIAVLDVANGRGGSSEVHRVAAPGAELSASAPLNSFRMQPAREYLFLAGGVGVTPLLPMAREAARAGVPWTFVYGGRTRASMAFLDVLSSLPGGHLEAVPQDERGRPDLAAAFAALSAGAAAYCCGPAGMLDAAVRTGASTRPAVPVHIERFQAAADPAARAGDPQAGADGPPFVVELARSGLTIEVPPGISVLDAVRARVPGVMSNCEQGICSACETAVLAGVPDHRDSVLTPREKAANGYMMICVSRSLTPRLVLDL